MIRLFTDSDTDITPELARKYGYTVISMPYSIDEEVVYPYVDFEVFDYKTFYDKMRQGVMPTTSALNPQKYIEYFEPVFAAGDDILYVHFSSAMTATFDFMHKALDELKVKYPNRKIYTIDTKAITIGSLSIVEAVGDMILAGKSVDEVIAWSKTEVDKYATYFYADDLKFFQRSGRVSGLTAVMGNLLGIKPIIFMDSDGVMKSISKERGRFKALCHMLQYVIDLGDEVPKHRIVIGHTDALKLAQDFEKMLRDYYGNDINVQTVVVNPTAGSHCGPTCIGVSFHAIHR